MFAAVAAVGLVVCGAPLACNAPRRTFQPTTDPSKLRDTTFVHYLATVPVVTVEEGVRAVLLLADSNAAASSFSERRAELIRLGAFKETWQLDGGDTLDKGTLAYMLRVVCKLARSFNERLAAPVGLGERRFALRNCAHAGLLLPGNARDSMTGGELLSAITRAETFRATTDSQPGG